MSPEKKFRLALLAGALALPLSAAPAMAQIWLPFMPPPDQPQQQKQKPQHRGQNADAQRQAQPQSIGRAQTHATPAAQAAAQDEPQHPWFWGEPDPAPQPRQRQAAIEPDGSPRNDGAIVDLTARGGLYNNGAAAHAKGAEYAVLPPDADPNYSTPINYDPQVNQKQSARKEIADPTGEAAGTITISTAQRKLYLSQGDGKAMEYGIAVGKQGFAWKGAAVVGRKSYWPGWTPPPEMVERHPELPAHMDGSMSNPLGARALYLFQDNKDTLFRIHGTNEPSSIGHAASSGCIRMHNADIIDLYGRVAKGARVVVR